MKTKFFSVLLVACMLLGVLAGCGSNAASSSTAAEASSDSELTEAAAPTAAQNETPAVLENSAVDAILEPADIEQAEHDIHFPNAENAQLDYSNDYSMPLSDDGDTLSMLTTAVNLMGDLGNQGVEEFNDFEYFQYLEELTGVHVDTTELNFFTAAEQMNVILASGDYPDMIKNIDTYYSTGLTGALDDDIIVDLTDDLSEYAPNYDYMIHSNDQQTQYFLKDGMVLQFMGTYENYVNNQGMVVRKDWLEEQGLEVPETYDELHDVLVAFKNAYNCSTPMYMTNNCAITLLTEGYNVAAYNAAGTGGASGTSGLPYYVEDGVVKCTLIEDGYRDYLTMLNSWYNEGLMDSDFISVEYDPFSSYLDGQITSDQMGVWVTSGEGIDNYTVPVTCMPSPVQNKGDKQHITEIALAPSDDITCVSISSACDDVELAMQWLDYWYSEDGIAFFNYGIEGKDYTLDENNEPKFTDAVVNNEFGLSASNYMRIRCAYGTMSSMMLRYRTGYLNSDLVNEAWDVWTSNIDGTMAISSNVSMTTEQKQQEGYHSGDILTYAAQMVAQFSIGDADIDSQWDEYVQKLKDMGIEECIALEQEAYDSTAR
jgi:putative aldouronate transport system substrate-binding protein